MILSSFHSYFLQWHGINWKNFYGIVFLDSARPYIAELYHKHKAKSNL